MAKPRWISPCIAHIDGRNVYRTCETASGELISTGDYVYLLPINPCVDFYIARVESMYEEDNEQKCVYVRWFYRPMELQHDPPSRPFKNEVYYTNGYDYQLVESIVGRCKVVPHNRVNLKRSSANETHATVHICRYSYSAEKGSFTLLHEDLDRPYLELSYDEVGETSHEDVAVARKLILILLKTERAMTKEIANAKWPLKRLAWILKAKNATSLKDVKEALVELETGLEIYKDRRGWMKTINAVSSPEMLENYIKCFKRNAQQKVDSLFNKPSKLNTAQSQLEDRTRKRKEPEGGKDANLEKQALEADGKHISETVAVDDDGKKPPLEIPDEQSCKDNLAGTISSGNAYVIDHRHLPSHAPAQLKHLRVVWVIVSTGHQVTIKFPSWDSINKYFGKNPDIDSTEALPHEPRCLSEQPQTVTGTNPFLDEHFVMSQMTAQKVLKHPISSAEYFHQRHFETFWLNTILDTIVKQSQSKSEQDNPSINKDEVYDRLGQDISSPHSPKRLDDNSSKRNSPLVFNVYTHKKFDRRKAIDSFPVENGLAVGNHRKLVSGNHIPECNESVQSGNEHATIDHVPSPTSVVAKDPSQKMFSHELSDGHDRWIQWAVRKKATSQYRCRGSSFSSLDSGNKRYKKEVVHSQSRLRRFGDLRFSSNKHIVKPDVSTITSMGKISVLKVPKDMQGRWSSERYKAAQLKLLDIMHEKGAVPGKPILRPALREEARKHIGDTGLLDHLLKHMTDMVVTNGERFCRRHNSEGAMEYWLEDASLKEIRKQAGVDDPRWIPPPGWRPGDVIHQDSFYGCVTGMSVPQMEKLKQLKDDVNKLKSQMHSLSVQMGTSLAESKSRSLLGRTNVLQSGEKFEKDIRTKTQRMSIELSNLRDAIEISYQTFSDEKHSSESEVMEGKSDGRKEAEKKLRRKLTKINHTGIQHCLDRVENDMRKLAEEITSRYKILSAEKKFIEAELHSIWTTVTVMQEDVNVILTSMGVSVPLPYEQVPALLPSIDDVINDNKCIEKLLKTDEAAIQTQHMQGNEESDCDDDIAFFQKAAYLYSHTVSRSKVEAPHKSSRFLPRPEDHTAEEITVLAAKENVLPGEERGHCGFQVCKPQGSFFWPGMGKSSSCLASKNFQVQDVLSSIQ